jgi:UDP-N-acetylglucosamine acyltransferase
VIHELAVVSSEARVHGEATIGPYAIIGPDVEIGAGSRIEAHVVVKGPTTIGEDNHIFQFASIGDDPQDKKYAGEPTKLAIGDRNTIRECCTINRGTTQDQGVTSIGDDNWIMAYAHIAHDCVVGNNTIFANNASIAGHVHVGDWAILGGFTTSHQFCHIGPHALTSMFTYITKDVPAFVVVSGRPAEPRGINAEGLRRRDYSTDQIRNIREAYRVLYRQGLKLEEATRALTERASTQEELRPLLESLQGSSRGLVR